MKTICVICFIILLGKPSFLRAQYLPRVYYILDFVSAKGNKTSNWKSDTIENSVNLTITEKKIDSTTYNWKWLYSVKINNKQYSFVSHSSKIKGHYKNEMTEPSELEIRYVKKSDRLVVVLKSDKKVKYYFKKDISRLPAVEYELTTPPRNN